MRKITDDGMMFYPGNEEEFMNFCARNLEEYTRLANIDNGPIYEIRVFSWKPRYYQVIRKTKDYVWLQRVGDLDNLDKIDLGTPVQKISWKRLDELDWKVIRE